MINYLKLRFKKSLAFIFIVLSISSCDKACFEAYQFDTESVSIDAKPTNDGIDGTYNNLTGGQKASWHDTNLRSDGGEITLSISGAWTAWDSAWEDVATPTALNAMQKCDICAKKNNVDNCICEPSQVPTSVPLADGTPTSNDCSGVNQEKKELCSCTTRHGRATDLDAYYFAKDYKEVDESLKNPDLQNECKFTQGMGLYLGMFGSDGNVNPNRVYHLYSTNKVCDVPIKDGQCKDAEGHDIYRYIYSSAGGKPFVKDDKAGNNGSDINTGDDEYHKSGERIKLIINDVYYDDNYGAYNVIFLSGILKAADPGLLELIVGSFEDIVIGKVGADGKRAGGVVEFLYTSIVQDSVFIHIVQALLVLYITIFGIGVLSGVVEMSRKDMSKRVMKIALVIFFTSQTSWYFYNQFVVGLFKDGMDSIIAMFMGLVDQNLDPNSLVVTAQMDRVQEFSHATRFSYVDLLLKKLYSQAAAAKIMGLLFGTYYGLITIPAIYGLIGYFTFVVVTAAIVYVTAMLKLIFVIALGPVFIVTSLFAQTEGMFKKWLAFMGARSLEILILFIVLYMFLVLIYSGFLDLLSFGVCTEYYNLGITGFNIPVSTVDRSFIGWVSGILKIGALIFMMKLIIEKIPMFSDAMASIGGVGSSAGGADERQAINTSAFGIANDVVGKLYNAGKKGISEGMAYTTRGVHGTAVAIGDATGAGDKLNELKAKIPFRGPLSIARDVSIDRSIKSAMRMAKNKKLTGKAYNEEVRKQTMELLAKESHSNSGKAIRAALGINGDAVARRLDEKLVKDPLKKIIEDEAKKLKSKDADSILLGSEMREQLRANVANRAVRELGSDAETIGKYLSNMKGLMAEQGELSSSEAAKKFAGRPELQNKFLAHLKESQVKKAMDYEHADETKLMGATRESIKNLGRSIRGQNVYNPKDVEENFIRKSMYEEKGENRGWFSRQVGIDTSKGWNLVKRINILDKFADKGRVEAAERLDKAMDIKDMNPRQRNQFEVDQKRADGAMYFEREQTYKSMSVSTDYIISGYKDELAQIRSKYNQEMRMYDAKRGQFNRREIEDHKREGENLVNEKLKKHARDLGDNLQSIRDAQGERDDGGAGQGNAVGAVPEPGENRIFDALEKLSNEGADFKSGERGLDNILEAKGLNNVLDEKGLNNILDEEGLNNFISGPVKEDLKNFHNQNKTAIESEINDLRGKREQSGRIIEDLKRQKELSPDDVKKLDQAEYDYSRANTQLSIKQAQLSMTNNELSKVS